MLTNACCKLARELYSILMGQFSLAITGDTFVAIASIHHPYNESNFKTNALRCMAVKVKFDVI